MRDADRCLLESRAELLRALLHGLHATRVLQRLRSLLPVVVMQILHRRSAARQGAFQQNDRGTARLQKRTDARSASRILHETGGQTLTAEHTEEPHSALMIPFR